jgi:hypothetical protein
LQSRELMLYRADRRRSISQPTEREADMAVRRREMSTSSLENDPVSPTGIERGMSPELQRVCREVQQLLNRNDARDAYDRYLIGTIIRDVRNQAHTYGEGSVGKIARVVGRDVDTLYEYADVAETWSQTEVTRLLERKTALGVPLSFSHLIELSKVRRDRDLLKALTERAFGGISARHLRALVEERRRGLVTNRATPPVAVSQLQRIVKLSQGLIEATQAFENHLYELSSVERTPKLVDLLQRTLQKQIELRRLCDENIRLLELEAARICADVLPPDDAEPPHPTRTTAQA